MSWLEKRKRYRLREEINGERITFFADLGIWKGPAETAKDQFDRAMTLGMRIVPKVTTMADIREFLKAYDEGREYKNEGQAIPIEELCDLYAKHHGPSLKGGITMVYNTPYYNLTCRLNLIKRAWKGKISDQITAHDVRDMLAPFKSVGNTLKYLHTVSNMFKEVARWGKKGIIPRKIKLPADNPATEWREEMKPSQKEDHALTRVLSGDEWQHFRPHLKRRARDICEIALRRFLRLADIKAISQMKITDGFIVGLQEKTGDKYKVPIVTNQPVKYDFTNFRKDFHLAQVAADMDYPKGHPLRFTARDLRRTGATWAWRKTRDLVGISKMLGHKKITTTIRYLNIDETDYQKIAVAVDEMASIKEGKKR